MATSVQLHPCLLVMNGMAAARAELRAAVRESRPAKLASEFLGALGEVQAAQVLGARHASHLFDEYDLEHGTVAIEVKSTMRETIGNVSLRGKICNQVCFVRFEARGDELWLVEMFTRPRGGTQDRIVGSEDRVYHLAEDQVRPVIW
ncbi:hypothetical protein [Qipengyuania citrea]|uniref:hypothetical protein n=1 Tax=Qipengyuania citrea TaxID=225971 RepID=UPI00329A0ACA